MAIYVFLNWLKEHIFRYVFRFIEQYEFCFSVYK
jgi:hypothetical protein